MKTFVEHQFKKEVRGEEVLFIVSMEQGEKTEYRMHRFPYNAQIDFAAIPRGSNLTLERLYIGISSSYADKIKDLIDKISKQVPDLDTLDSLLLERGKYQQYQA